MRYREVLSGHEVLAHYRKEKDGSYVFHCYGMGLSISSTFILRKYFSRTTFII